MILSGAQAVNCLIRRQIDHINNDQWQLDKLYCEAVEIHLLKYFGEEKAL